MKKSSHGLSDMDIFLIDKAALSETTFKLTATPKKKNHFKKKIQKIQLEKSSVTISGIESIEVDRKNMTYPLAVTDNKYQLLLEGSRDAFWDCDLSSHTIIWNSRFYEMLGLHSLVSEMPCKNMLAFLHPDEIPGLLQNMTAFLKSQESIYECEIRLRHASGVYRYYLCRGRVLRNDLGSPVRFSGALTDITRYKTAEHELQHRNEQLTQSNQDLEQFAFIASHDLRTPVRKALTFCTFLKNYTEDELNPEARQWLSRMELCMQSMQNLIDGLLSYSRISNNITARQPVSLKPLVSEILSDFEEPISELNAEIQIGDLPIIEADPVQMRQLFQNLISNALKFHRPGVPPVIQIGSQVLPDSDASSAENNPPRLCQIQVKDNGIGFDEKYSHWIFLMFQRLQGNNQPDGDGIGLAICKKIVERHGGTINVKSRIGDGSTFFIDLPVYQVQAETALMI